MTPLGIGSRSVIMTPLRARVGTGGEQDMF